MTDRPPALDSSQARDNTILVVLFLVVNRVLNLQAAIAVATVWAIRSMVIRRRSGSPIGKFMPVVLVYLLVRGALGIFYDSEDVYFGIGIGVKVLFGVVLIGSAIIGKPLMSRLLPLVFPFDDETKRHAIYHSTMRRLSWLAGGFLLVSSIWDVWLLNNQSVTGFVLLRFLLTTGTGIATFIGGFFYAQRRLDRIPGFEGLLPMLDRMSTM